MKKWGIIQFPAVKIVQSTTPLQQTTWASKFFSMFYSNLTNAFQQIISFPEFSITAPLRSFRFAEYSSTLSWSWTYIIILIIANLPWPTCETYLYSAMNSWSQGFSIARYNFTGEQNDEARKTPQCSSQILPKRSLIIFPRIFFNCLSIFQQISRFF